MIEELEIRDLGVIAHSVMPLKSGFTAITGETGAGKTMVVAALGLLMGARSDAATVRRGAPRARITGIINTDIDDVIASVEELGGDMSEGELILSRTVSSEGRSRATVGGTAAPAAALGRLSPLLFAVHGQSDQLRLQSAKAQREMLDRFGGDALGAVLRAYAEAFTARAATEQQLNTISQDQQERLREAEQLQAELEEINRIEPLDDEDEQVRARIERLGNVEALRTAADEARNVLTAEGDDPFARDAAALLAQALGVLESARDDPDIQRLYEAVGSVQVQLVEVASDLASFSNQLDEEGPEELARASARLEDLIGLARRFGPSMLDVNAYAQRANERLSELGSDDFTIEHLTEQLRTLTEQEDELAKKLTTLRMESAQALSVRVSTELRDLALPDAELVVQVSPQTPALHGRDNIELLLVPHKGSDARPIAKGASGGELSRIMLALEVSIAEVDPVPTFVFDEVDAGVGGQAAIEVGRRLRKLAETSQVIVVTHLAQVASFAHHHVRITKDSSGDFTESSCSTVTGDARLQEVARLLSGMSDSTSALEHASELLALGNE